MLPPYVTYYCYFYGFIFLSVGMAATLALLKGTGELGKKEELAGRTKDQRSSDPSSLGGILCTSHPVDKHTFLPLTF